MNQHNNQNQTPGSGVEMRQLTFLAVILAALLVLVLGAVAFFIFGRKIKPVQTEQEDSEKV